MGVCKSSMSKKPKIRIERMKRLKRMPMSALGNKYKTTPGAVLSVDFNVVMSARLKSLSSIDI